MGISDNNLTLGPKTDTKMKITKRQLRRIIKEEKAKLQEAYEYNPVDEMYTMLDHLQKAQLIAEEIVAFSEREEETIDDDFGMPFFSFSNQLKKLMGSVGSQADKAYRQDRDKSKSQPSYRDELDPGDVI